MVLFVLFAAKTVSVSAFIVSSGSLMLHAPFGSSRNKVPSEVNVKFPLPFPVKPPAVTIWTAHARSPGGSGTGVTEILPV